jgi:uncharacterized membrane protein YhhN
MKNLKDNHAVLIAVLFTAAIGVSTFLTLNGYSFDLKVGWMNDWVRPMTLTTTLILLLAASSFAGGLPRYKWSIVAGLFFSLGGDVFLMNGEKYFLPGLLSFLFGHICYLIAFTTRCGFAIKRLPFFFGAIFGAAMIALLWREIPGNLKIPVVLYVVTILCMAAQATSRFMSLQTFAAFCSCLGAILFVVSDSSLAWNHFRHEIANSKTIVLGTYFTAQWLIALSVTFRK